MHPAGKDEIFSRNRMFKVNFMFFYQIFMQN